MAAYTTRNKARQAILLARIVACLLPVGSLVLLIGAAALVSKTPYSEFFTRLGSPFVLLPFGLFYLIYIPASIRIYYTLLLNAKGVFETAERQKYQHLKQKWDKYLLRAGLIAGISAVILAVCIRLAEVSP